MNAVLRTTQGGQESFLAGGELGLYRSPDSGQRFTSILTDTYVMHIASSQDGQILYAGVFLSDPSDSATGGVRRSMDGGETFEDLSEGLGSPIRADVRWVTLHPTDPMRAFAGTTGMGAVAYHPSP